MSNEPDGMIDPDSFREQAVNFDPNLREQTAHATEIYLQLRAKGEKSEGTPALHDYLTTLASDTNTPIHDVDILGDSLMRFPQLPVDMVVDLGGGNMAALPLGRVHARQLEKLRIANAAGIEMDDQGKAMADKAKEVIAKLNDADRQEGVETRLFILQAQIDKSRPRSDEDDKLHDLFWKRILPNYISGMELKKIAAKRVAESSKNN